MSRDNFISDNLINIREKLRQNPVKSPADEINVSLLEKNSASVNKQENSSSVFVSELPPPAPRMQTRAPGLDRERRELAGRIRRDYSWVAAELEAMDKKRCEATAFLEFLAKHQKEIDSINVDLDGSARELDSLVWEYYRMAGRWKAFSSSVSDVAGTQENGSNNGRTERRSCWLVPAAILLGAVIVSVSLLVSFL